REAAGDRQYRGTGSDCADSRSPGSRRRASRSGQSEPGTATGRSDDLTASSSCYHPRRRAGRAGFGSRRAVPAFPRERGRFRCLNNEGAGGSGRMASLDPPSWARRQLASMVSLLPQWPLIRTIRKTSNARAGTTATRTLLRTGAMFRARDILNSFRFCIRVGRFVLFDLGLECCERTFPDMFEPSVQHDKAVRVDVVVAQRALGPVRHETGILQHLEVLRYRRAAYRHVSRDLADGARPGAEVLEHFTAGRIRKGSQRVFVSHALP